MTPSFDTTPLVLTGTNGAPECPTYIRVQRDFSSLAEIKDYLLEKSSIIGIELSPEEAKFLGELESYFRKQ